MAVDINFDVRRTLLPISEVWILELLFQGEIYLTNTLGLPDIVRAIGKTKKRIHFPLIFEKMLESAMLENFEEFVDSEFNHWIVDCEFHLVFRVLEWHTVKF